MFTAKNIILVHDTPWQQPICRLQFLESIWSCSKEDSDGSQNITFKMNTRFVLLCWSLKVSNVGKFSRSWFLGDCTEVYKEKENYFVVRCLCPPLNMQLGILTLKSCSDNKEIKVQKSIMHIQSCCFSNLLLFWHLIAIVIAKAHLLNTCRKDLCFLLLDPEWNSYTVCVNKSHYGCWCESFGKHD